MTPLSVTGVLALFGFLAFVGFWFDISRLQKQVRAMRDREWRRELGRQVETPIPGTDVGEP